MSGEEAQLLESDHEHDALNGEHGSLSNDKTNTVGVRLSPNSCPRKWTAFRPRLKRWPDLTPDCTSWKLDHPPLALAQEGLHCLKILAPVGTRQGNAADTTLQ